MVHKGYPGEMFVENVERKAASCLQCYLVKLVFRFEPEQAHQVWLTSAWHNLATLYDYIAQWNMHKFVGVPNVFEALDWEKNYQIKW